MVEEKKSCEQDDPKVYCRVCNKWLGYANKENRKPEKIYCHNCKTLNIFVVSDKNGNCPAVGNDK